MAVLVVTQAAIPGFIFRYATAVHTNPAIHTTGIIRRHVRQTEFQPALAMNPCGNFQCLPRPPANARQAETQDLGNVRRAPVA
jgi:hypothetical protein